eukprot:jgi/Picre1/28588/NNA_003990.t1
MRSEFTVWHDGDDMYYVMHQKEENDLMVNFHTTLTGEAMVTMLYHKKLDDGWTEHAKKMRESIIADCQGLTCLHVIGRSRKQKICLDKRRSD